MNRAPRFTFIAAGLLISAATASASLPPVFFFGPPRNVIIGPVGPWIPVDGPVDGDAPPLPDVPAADSVQAEHQAAIWIPAPPPEPLPYPGPGQPEES